VSKKSQRQGNNRKYHIYIIDTRWSQPFPPAGEPEPFEWYGKFTSHSKAVAKCVELVLTGTTPCAKIVKRGPQGHELFRLGGV
jgi:hypothetical protein